MKVLVELYDGNQLLNLLAAWQLHPSRIILLYRAKQKQLIHQSSMKKMIQNCSLEYLEYSHETLEQIIKDLISQYSDLVFDMHGGEDYAIAMSSHTAAAAGSCLCYADLSSMTFITYQNGVRCSNTLVIPKMSVKEYVALSGAAVIPEQEHEFDAEGRKAVSRILEVKHALENRWDHFCTAVSHMEKIQEGTRQAWLLKSSVYQDYQEAFQTLEREGICMVSSQQDGMMKLQLKDPAYYRLLSTYGLSLEYSVYDQLKYSGCFDDVDLRVNVDWNGGTHEPADATSELDVMATRDGVLAVISCKGGELNEQAIYEVKTNAMKFGKTLAVPVLCNDKKKAPDQLCDKAKQLDVLLLQRDALYDQRAADQILYRMQAVAKR